MKQSKKGFTLVEMMLVIAIIVILAGTAMVSIGDSLRKSQESQERYEEHALLVEDVRDNIHTMMHVNPPTYTPAPPTNNGGGGNPGVGGGGVGGGGGETPAVGGGGAPEFLEPEDNDTDVTIDDNETTDETTDSVEADPNNTESGTGSESGSGSSTGSGSGSGSSTGSGSGSSTGSGSGSGSSSSESSASDKVVGSITVKGGFVTDDQTSGVRNVISNGDGSYDITIGTRWNHADFKLSISGDTITFYGGGAEGVNKYALQNDGFSFSGKLWSGETFQLTSEDKARFEELYNLVIN